MISSNNILPNIFKFYDKETLDLLDVISINLDAGGEIASVTTQSGETYFKNDFFYTNLILEVPGLGRAMCGDLITLKVKTKISDFILGFGWHVNISNQKIYSWYLLPTDKKLLNKPDSEFTVAKTLYYDDLISIIAITNQMPHILPDDITSGGEER